MYTSVRIVAIVGMVTIVHTPVIPGKTRPRDRDKESGSQLDDVTGQKEQRNSDDGQWHVPI